jgi:U4/U6.U5 tri-snRNP-associated protein 1
MPAIKEEPMDEDGAIVTESGTVVLDATSEYCRNLGEIPTYGLAGNRVDGIDVDELMEETETAPVAKVEEMEEEEDDAVRYATWRGFL